MISPFSASICVYCGSRTGDDPAFLEAAQETGTMIAEENWRLVYGAGDVGLMGAVANAAQEAGAQTFGVIPTHLMSREVGKRDLTNFIVTENMHERKKVMYMNADAIVVMPGGAGSMDEFFEVLTWRQLGLHAKPIYLLSPNGYWEPLVKLVDHIIDQGFADASLRDFIQIVGTAAELREALRADLSSAKLTAE
ncbi:TIGR00730 family Rossman fold protein [Falsihalocynthiibacter sp. SS001]|uniref:LOG family protein n=1 Tax=Falsihalocynthiibacter sp. SS001 TaxID=3349698 RepID=UPI0036D28D50